MKKTKKTSKSTTSGSLEKQEELHRDLGLEHNLQSHRDPKNHAKAPHNLLQGILKDQNTQLLGQV